MKTPLLKLALLFIVIFTSINSFAQDFQGKAYYQTKTTMNIDQWGRREMSAEQKKRMQERMKSFLEKEYILTFNKIESVYKEDEKLEAPGSARGFRGFRSSFSGGPKYKNVKDKQVIQHQEFFGKQFLIKDELKTLEWKMGAETKQIGQYTCFKATATKTVNQFDWRSMRRKRDSRGKEKVENDGKNKDKEQSKTKTADSTISNPKNDTKKPKIIKVVAWYTPQIPINQGPDDYWGLPGLILEVNADKTTILCTKIVMNPEEKELIEEPKKGKEVTQAEYTKIITKKMQEMQEMYGRRGGRRDYRGSRRH